MRSIGGVRSGQRSFMICSSGCVEIPRDGGSDGGAYTERSVEQTLLTGGNDDKTG